MAALWLAVLATPPPPPPPPPLSEINYVRGPIVFEPATLTDVDIYHPVVSRIDAGEFGEYRALVCYEKIDRLSASKVADVQCRRVRSSNRARRAHAHCAPSFPRPHVHARHACSDTGKWR